MQATQDAMQSGRQGRRQDPSRSLKKTESSRGPPPFPLIQSPHGTLPRAKKRTLWVNNDAELPIHPYIEQTNPTQRPCPPPPILFLEIRNRVEPQRNDAAVKRKVRCELDKGAGRDEAILQVGRVSICAG